MSKPINITVVEDDPATRMLLANYFPKESFNLTLFETGEGVIEAVRQHQPDLVLLDLSLPVKDGMTLTKEIRTFSNTGIILISANTDSIERIIGLEVGADDYVTKPFNPRELLARRKNLARRVREAQTRAPKHNLREFLGWVLAFDKRQLKNPDGKAVQLTEGEFLLLDALTRSAGTVLSRDELLQALGNRSWSPNDRTVDVLIGRLRRKLKHSNSPAELIITIRSAGYLFNAEVVLR